MKICIICNKEFINKHPESNCGTCSRKCKREYHNTYGKNGLPQRNENNLLLCYDCLEYRKDEDFWTYSSCKTLSPLRNGKARACYLCNRKRRNLAKKVERETIDGILKNRLQTAKTKSTKREIYFDKSLTIDYLKDIYNQQEGKCALSGKLLECGKLNNKTLSIDRIDSEKGYEKGNIQLVCWAVNRMKQDIPQEEFFNWCQKIVEKQLVEIY